MCLVELSHLTRALGQACAALKVSLSNRVAIPLTLVDPCCYLFPRSTREHRSPPPPISWGPVPMVMGSTHLFLHSLHVSDFDTAKPGCVADSVEPFSFVRFSLRSVHHIRSRSWEVRKPAEVCSDELYMFVSTTDVGNVKYSCFFPNSSLCLAYAWTRV